MRPPEFAPGALARQSQARERNRTSPNFCKPRPQWAGRNRRPPLRFCAPEGFFPPQGVTPVMGDRGEAVLWARSARRPRPPAILWFLSHRWERNSPPAGGETPLRKEPSSGPMRASGPTKKRSIIAPSSAPFGGTYPYPLCRFATSPLDKGSRPPEGKAFGGSAPHPPPLRGHLPPRGKAFEGERPSPSGGGLLGKVAPYGLCCVSRSRENPQSWNRRSTETQKVTASSKTTRPMA